MLWRKKGRLCGQKNLEANRLRSLVVVLIEVRGWGRLVLSL